MWKIRLPLLALASLLSACATSGPEIETRIVDTACQWVKPIYVSRDDVLTDGTADAILAHNITGAARCGWAKKSPR